MVSRRHAASLLARSRPREATTAAGQVPVDDAHRALPCEADRAIEATLTLRRRADCLHVRLGQARPRIEKGSRQMPRRRGEDTTDNQPLEIGLGGRSGRTTLPGLGRAWTVRRCRRLKGSRSPLDGPAIRGRWCVKRAEHHAASEDHEAQQDGSEPCRPGRRRRRARLARLGALREEGTLLQPRALGGGQFRVDENEFGADRLQDKRDFSLAVPSSSATRCYPQARLPPAAWGRLASSA
jgi:hypothetical protein